MAGSSMTFTYDTGPGPVKRIIADWTSDDTTGAVSGTTTVKASGFLLRAVTDPGTAAPTASYDIAITDDEGADVLGNCFDDLADRHTSNTESVDFFLNDGTTSNGARPSVCSELTFSVTNAGNSKTGQVILYLEGELSGNF